MKYFECFFLVKVCFKFVVEEVVIFKKEVGFNVNKIILSMKCEVEEVKCNFEVLYDMLDLGESYVLLFNVEDNLCEVEIVI